MSGSEKKLPPIKAEEYYRITENYPERTELLNGEIVAPASPSIRHQTISGALLADVREFIKRNGGSCKPLLIVDPKNAKIVVYDFEKSDLPDIYTFDTPIPVGIFGGGLAVRIADLL